MNLARFAVERPVVVAAVVVVILLFGLVALRDIPIQLAPDVRRPVVTITTVWPGAAPAEIEREIVVRQEDTLRGLEGVRETVSRSLPGRAEITLEFAPGSNMDRALLLVANRLDQVTSYPEEADRPSIATAGAEDTPIAWLGVLRAPGNDRAIHTYGDFVETVIRDRIERVQGVARVNVFGGAERELQIVVDPFRLAQLGLTVADVGNALRGANASISGGDVDQGKRRYVVRTDGEVNTVERARAIVLRAAQGEPGSGIGRVTLGDVAEIRFGHKEPQATIRNRGEPAIAVNVVRQTGANVIETMREVEAVVEELNRSVLPGEGLRMRLLSSEKEYVEKAIANVLDDMKVGAALAVLVLLLFLRSPRATLVIALAIPVSVVGAFLAMAGLGMSLNVVSLAGLAFAVGNVVDAAIVVQETIDRLRREGVPARAAAIRAAREVWAAILISALTTVLVFVPIILTPLEVGQLFRDMAVAISAALILSLLVAVTLIPCLASRLLPDAEKSFRLPLIDPLSERVAGVFAGVARLLTADRRLGLGVVATVTAAALLGTWWALPKLEYLPEGSRNQIFGVLVPPPGYNLATTTAIAERVETAAAPLWQGPQPEGGPPQIDNFFFVAQATQSFLGASAVDGRRVAELGPVLRAPALSEPGTFGIFTQPSIFGRGIGGGRTINLDVSGPDLPRLVEVARRAVGRLSQALPRETGNQFRPLPGLELGAPEVRVVPDATRLADAGVTARQLGLSVDAFNDGLRVEEITVDGRRIDITLKGPDGGVAATPDIGDLPVVTPSGHVLPVRALADVQLTAGPTEIRRVDRERTVTLAVVPAESLPLEAAVDILEREVIAPLLAEGLPPGVELRISGTADRLGETRDALAGDLLLAALVVFLAMAVTFGNFLYPVVVMFSIPVALAGGVAGLALLNLHIDQKLDMLTLLGFAILIGTVVSNAVLLVDQSLRHYREDGMDVRTAVVTAARNRVRPIFMTSFTGIFGMLPLALSPGEGAELYRGLGVVVVGGQTLSTLLTLVLVPPLLAIVIPLVEGRTGRSNPAHAMAPAS